MPGANEPTEQLLRETCARMAQRFRWTESFETVMQDPARGRMVRLAALHRSACGAAVRRAAPVVRRRRLDPLPPQRSFFDNKRAAAGEREDD